MQHAIPPSSEDLMSPNPHRLILYKVFALQFFHKLSHCQPMILLPINSNTLCPDAFYDL